jgi:hypothetical protein
MRIVNNRVLGHMGDVLAEKINGKWETKDPNVIAFILKTELDAEEELVRARNEKGHFIADDPTTPENEAFVVKLVKKAKRKKKVEE